MHSTRYATAMPTRLISLCGMALLQLSGCKEERLCGDVGCASALDLTLRTADNTWPAGRYAFEFTFDRDMHTCAIDLLPGLPPGPSEQPALPCVPELQAYFNAEVLCSEVHGSGRAGPSCTPIQDHWILHVNDQRAPDQLRVRALRETTSILDVDERVDYDESFPNGPGCGGPCKRAEVELRLD
jgi:hypothetical protein